MDLMGAKVERLCDLFASMKWQSVKEVQKDILLGNKTDTDQQVMILDAATFVVIQLETILRDISDTHLELKKKVKQVVKDKVIEKKKHLEGICKSNWGDDIDLQHIAALVGVHSACLQLAYSDKGEEEEVGQEEQRKGFQSMLDCVVEMLVKISRRGSRLVHDSVAWQIMSCLEQFHKAGWNPSTVLQEISEVKNQQALDENIFSFVDQAVYVDNCLAILAVMYGTLTPKTYRFSECQWIAASCKIVLA